MKKYISFILISLLTFSLSSPAFASATSSDADELTLEDYLANYEKIPLSEDNPGLGVTSSDDEWMGDDGNLVASSSDWDFESWYDDVQSDLNISNSSNVVPFSVGEDELSSIRVTAEARNRSTQGLVGTKSPTKESAGTTGIEFNFPVLPSNQYYSNLRFNIPKSLFPRPGKYGVVFKFQEADLGLPDSGNGYVRVYSYSDADHVQGTLLEKASFSTSNGTTYKFQSNITIGYNTTDILFYVDWPFSQASSYLDCVLNLSCLQFTFVEFPDVPSVVAPDASNNSAADYTAQNTGQIAQNTASMNDTLKEIVQTISKQLEALWNQQYNYIHLEDMANADKNADKIVAGANQNTWDIMENDDRISEDIMDNDDKNTDTIVNGYDGSGIDADNSRLDSSINEYEEAESEVLDKVNDELGGFEFSDSIDGYVSAVSLISGFLQDIYDNSGGFKDVINIGFFLSIASIVIGMYRFKEG